MASLFDGFADWMCVASRASHGGARESDQFISASRNDQRRRGRGSSQTNKVSRSRGRGSATHMQTEAEKGQTHQVPNAVRSSIPLRDKLTCASQSLPGGEKRTGPAVQAGGGRPWWRPRSRDGWMLLSEVTGRTGKSTGHGSLRGTSAGTNTLEVESIAYVMGTCALPGGRRLGRCSRFDGDGRASGRRLRVPDGRRSGALGLAIVVVDAQRRWRHNLIAGAVLSGLELSDCSAFCFISPMGRSPYRYQPLLFGPVRIQVERQTQ